MSRQKVKKETVHMAVMVCKSGTLNTFLLFSYAPMVESESELNNQSNESRCIDRPTTRAKKKDKGQ